MEDNKYSKWVFTWNNDNVIDLLPDIDQSKLESILKTFCKSYVFQTERETRTHYQGFFVTKIRKRKQTILTHIKELMEPEYHEAYVQNLTIERMLGSEDEAKEYCTKTDSRIDAPVYYGYTLPYEAKDLAVLQNIENWYPWQINFHLRLFNSKPGEKFSGFAPINDRKIFWIKDSVGNNGKSKYVKNICNDLPEETCKVAFGSSSQLRSALISAGPRTLYFIDIPRSLGRDDNIFDIISTIEDLKNGFLVTSMYGTYKSLMFDPPHIVVFSNMNPPKDAMSPDRWIMYEINNKYLTKNNYADSGHFYSDYENSGHNKNDL